MYLFSSLPNFLVDIVVVAFSSFSTLTCKWESWRAFLYKRAHQVVKRKTHLDLFEHCPIGDVLRLPLLVLKPPFCLPVINMIEDSATDNHLVIT